MSSQKVVQLRPFHTDYEETAGTGAGYADDKFTRTGGLLAGAQAKWVVCKAKQGIDPAPFGQEDNFFQSPTSYDRWLGEVEDETLPECRTLDEKTGCVKCVVAVKDEHGCHIRLNITLESVFKAASKKKYPFLMTDYAQWHEVII